MEKFFVALMLVGRSCEVTERFGSHDSLEEALEVVKKVVENDFSDDDVMDEIVFEAREHDYINKKGNKVWDFGADEISFVIMTNEFPSVTNL